MRRHLTGSAAALAAALLLSSCGSTSAEPDPLPPAKASTTPSPSATPPTMPEAASEKTKAGAKAAVRHFLLAMTYAGSTGDTQAFDSAYTASCTKCEAISDGIRETYAKGGSILGGAWRLRQITVYAIEDDIATVDVVVDYAKQTYIADASAPASTSPARKNVLKAFQLVWQDARWRVGALDPEL